MALLTPTREHTRPLMTTALDLPALLCTVSGHHWSQIPKLPSLPGLLRYLARYPALLLLCSDVKRGFIAEEEDKKQKWRRWKSIYVMYFTMFITALSKFTCISQGWSIQEGCKGVGLTTSCKRAQLKVGHTPYWLWVCMCSEFTHVTVCTGSLYMQWVVHMHAYSMAPSIRVRHTISTVYLCGYLCVSYSPPPPNPPIPFPLQHSPLSYPPYGPIYWRYVHYDNYYRHNYVYIHVHTYTYIIMWYVHTVPIHMTLCICIHTPMYVSIP